MTTPNIEQIINNVVSTFQKEKRREFIIDNDSEYSKLYLSRDQNGSAHGLFFINLEELLKNNSQMYSTLPGIPDHLLDVISQSKFLKLNVYRDRVKEHVIGKRRINYSDRTSYQEPSTLIQVSETPINATSLSPENKALIKYFSFSDHEVALKAAGMYQYRVEISFKDGTYEYLYGMYKELAVTKKLLEQYYDLSISSYTDPAAAGFEYDSNRTTKEYSKAVFSQYFKNGSYNQQFALKVAETFADTLSGFESKIVPKIINAFRIFLGQTNQNLEQKSLLIRNNLDPVTGSPKGIQSILKLTEVFIDRLEVALGLNKLKKVSSNFTAKGYTGAYDNSSLLNNIVSQSSHTIYEEHSFDHPAELFQAISNKDLYSDYLSLDSDTTETQAAMRTVSAKYFMERCELENTKFSAKPLSPTDTEPVYDISLFTQNQNATNNSYERTSSPKYLSDTGFSYLAPSVIKLFTGTKEKNYVYKPLDRDPRQDEVLEEMLVTLTNYSFTKQDEKNADLFDAHFSYEDLGYDFSLRESYKEVFENLGMTVHDLNLHQEFFEDSRGAAKIAGADCIEPLKEAEVIVPGAMQLSTHTQYVINDFSDSTITPNLYFKNFLNSKDAASIKLAPVLLRNYTFSAIGNTSNFYNLPNSFKFSSISSNHLLAGSEISSPRWRAMTQDLNFSGPYLFFNLNLTVKIEAFRGKTGNAKYDEESWSLLTKEDLRGQAGNLLCKISYYNEKLTRNLNLPILDKYFLINSAVVSTGVQEAVARTSRELLVGTPSFWSETNDRAAAAYARSTGQDTKLTTTTASTATTRASRATRTPSTTPPTTRTPAARATTTRSPTTTTSRATTTSTTSTGRGTSGGGTSGGGTY